MVTEALAPLADVPLLALLVRMAGVAVFITIVALISERVGPFFGAMAASLPIYTGPLYLFFAIDYPPEYLARVATGSVAAFAVIPVFVIIYAVMARAKHGMLLSLMAGLGVWICCAVIIQISNWSLVESLLFAVPIFAVTLLLSRHFTDATAVKPTGRHWIDLPLRVLLVSSVVGIVNALSPFLPERITGILSIMPTVTTSLILVLHGRIGGLATAALLAYTVGGLIGMLMAVTLVAATVVPWGPALSLSAALALCVAWNLMLIALKHGRSLFNKPSRAGRSRHPVRAPR